MTLPEVGQGKLPADRLDQSLVGEPDAGQLALDAGRREPQVFADRLQGRPAVRQPGADRHPYPIRQRLEVVRLRAQRFEAGAHHRHHLRIAARHGLFQHVRPEHQRIGRLGEAGRSAEGGLVLFGVQRPGVLEIDRLRRPASPQTLAEDVEEHAEGQIGVLAALHDVGGADLVLEHQQTVVPGGEAEQRVLLVKRERVDDVPQRDPQRG